MMFRLGASAILGIARTNVFDGRGQQEQEWMKMKQERRMIAHKGQARHMIGE